MPRLSRIAIYPLKSCDAMLVETAAVLSNGALQHDRRFALVDETGKIINAKRTSAVHRLKLVLDPQTRILTASLRSSSETSWWNVDTQRADAESWLSEYFAYGVTLVERAQGGFPDDDQAPGPTIVSTATLETVASWFPGLTLDDVRHRFRANLEISDVESFWEDRLYRSTGPDRPFRAGDVVFGGSNPCQRCVVPSRDAASGEVYPNFVRQFSQRREQQLPPWAPRERFDHFYRLAVNTRLISAGSELLRVGDEVELLD